MKRKLKSKEKRTLLKLKEMRFKDARTPMLPSSNRKLKNSKLRKNTSVNNTVNYSVRRPSLELRSKWKELRKLRLEPPSKWKNKLKRLKSYQKARRDRRLIWISNRRPPKLPNKLLLKLKRNLLLSPRLVFLLLLRMMLKTRRWLRLKKL